MNKLLEAAPPHSVHMPIQILESEKLLFNTKEVAELTGIPKATLEVWRCRGQGPKYVKLSNGVYYRKHTLLQYFEAHEVKTADQQ
ncbi:helix-turn-helix transcriptional regulator [Oleidesulfovibrio alaskensis]|jgi:hypothetical protein|uniref:helix-turn-helix transcriptional regulator n=1 Tax=Oleidesulfovibrio alaskensis TaxID=58180 RepID=UPI00042A40CB|nr:helix-turn-helix domain-containing protein [Oleidesulfovibrio alaskensis]